MLKFSITIEDKFDIARPQQMTGEFIASTRKLAEMEARNFYAAELDTEPKKIGIVSVKWLGCECGSKEFYVHESIIHWGDMNEDGKIETHNEEPDGIKKVYCTQCETVAKDYDVEFC